MAGCCKKTSAIFVFADLTPDGFYFWMTLSLRTSEPVRHAPVPPGAKFWWRHWLDWRGTCNVCAKNMLRIVTWSWTAKSRTGDLAIANLILLQLRQYFVTLRQMRWRWMVTKSWWTSTKVYRTSCGWRTNSCWEKDRRSVLSLDLVSNDSSDVNPCPCPCPCMSSPCPCPGPWRSGPCPCPRESSPC